MLTRREFLATACALPLALVGVEGWYLAQLGVGGVTYWRHDWVDEHYECAEFFIAGQLFGLRVEKDDDDPSRTTKMRKLLDKSVRQVVVNYAGLAPYAS